MLYTPTCPTRPSFLFPISRHSYPHPIIPIPSFQSHQQLEHEELRLLREYNPDHATEQALWFNGAMTRLWQYLAPILEQNISKSVESVLVGPQ